ncbi:MAG: tetratricopeptide repeat protein [Trichormus sp. ATA11-4-KO1]|jgi:tetratricopeptide (TPR) repeat protein|nr:tetratricopeptide repeat protein [Trichormus sp. ATA11-4-KO1]
MTEPHHTLEQQKRVTELWMRSLENQLRQQSVDDASIIQKFNEMAEAFCLQGKNLQAEALWVRSLDVAQRCYEDNKLVIGFTLKRLVAFYRSQQRYSETEPLLKQSLQIWQHLFGNEHPLVATNLNDLAAVYHRQGRYSEAENFYLQAIPLLLNKLKNEHPDTQNALQNFRHLLKQAVQENRVAELSNHPFTQSALEKELLDFQERQPNERRTLVVTEQDIEDLRKLTLSQGKNTGNALFWVQLVEKNLRQQGADHLSVAKELNNEAKVCRSQGKNLEAEALWQRSLEIYQQHLNNADPYLGVILNNLASFYLSQKRYSEAESLFLEAISILIKTLGNDHSTTVSVWENFAVLLGLVQHENRVAELSNHPITQALLPH